MLAFAIAMRDKRSSPTARQQRRPAPSTVSRVESRGAGLGYGDGRVVVVRIPLRLADSRQLEAAEGAARVTMKSVYRVEDPCSSPYVFSRSPARTS